MREDRSGESSCENNNTVKPESSLVTRGHASVLSHLCLSSLKLTHYGERLMPGTRDGRDRIE